MGLALCSLLAVLLMFSSPWIKGSYAWGWDGIDSMIVVSGGGILAVRYEQPLIFFGASDVAANINRMPRPYEFVWWPDTYRDFGEMGVVLPLWMLIGLFLVPTAFLWWRDRRVAPPGHCRSCGYDLTGNVSGRCPECGAAVKGRTDAHS